MLLKLILVFTFHTCTCHDHDNLGYAAFTIHMYYCTMTSATRLDPLNMATKPTLSKSNSLCNHPIFDLCDKKYLLSTKMLKSFWLFHVRHLCVLCSRWSCDLHREMRSRVKYPLDTLILLVGGKKGI